MDFSTKTFFKEKPYRNYELTYLTLLCRYFGRWVSFCIGGFSVASSWLIAMASRLLGFKKKPSSQRPVATGKPPSAWRPKLLEPWEPWEPFPNVPHRIRVPHPWHHHRIKRVGNLRSGFVDPIVGSGALTSKRSFRLRRRQGNFSDYFGKFFRRLHPDWWKIAIHADVRNWAMSYCWWKKFLLPINRKMDEIVMPRNPRIPLIQSWIHEPHQLDMPRNITINVQMLSRPARWI